jgi:hypothetical protein
VKPKHPPFSSARLWGIIVKEFIQMRRDRLTFAMMPGIPVLQLLLFGFAINADSFPVGSDACDRRCGQASCRHEHAC